MTSVKITTSVHLGGPIAQDVLRDRRFFDVRQAFERRILDVQDAQIREALIKLGWTPPPKIDAQYGLEVQPSGYYGEASLQLRGVPVATVDCHSAPELGTSMEFARRLAALWNEYNNNKA